MELQGFVRALKFAPSPTFYPLLHCVASEDWVSLAGTSQRTTRSVPSGRRPLVGGGGVSWIWFRLVHGGGRGVVICGDLLQSHFPSQGRLVHDLWMSGVVERGVRDDSADPPAIGPMPRKTAPGYPL